jgi:hypothetical protein
MNLFRSEGHVRNWAEFVEGAEEGMVPLGDMAKLFSGPLFTRRLDDDYLANIKNYSRQFAGDLKKIGKTGPFWSLG